MGDAIGLSDLSDNSFEADFRTMIETGIFALNDEQKSFLRQVFPDRTFKGGCKSCWADAVIEYINSLNPIIAQPKLEVAEGELLLIDEAKYGYSHMGVKINGELVLIAKDIEEVLKIARGKRVISETSTEAQAFFHENKLLHKYLKK